MITSSGVPQKLWLHRKSMHKPSGHQQVNPDPEPELLNEELMVEDTDEDEWFEWEETDG